MISEKNKSNIGELFRQAMPQDLIKFGLIPEFVGRVPVNVALDVLDEAALVKILVEPKNAITKQYKKLFEIDGVELEFDEGAIEEIAKKSFSRKIGARGLRSIMEASMMDTMFEIPSDSNIIKCIITREVIQGTEKPKLIMAEEGVVENPL